MNTDQPTHTTSDRTENMPQHAPRRTTRSELLWVAAAAGFTIGAILILAGLALERSQIMFIGALFTLAGVCAAGYRESIR